MISLETYLNYFSVDPCYPNPCRHDGICKICDDPECENEIECDCQEGYFGEFCNIRKFNKMIIVPKLHTFVTIGNLSFAWIYLTSIG